MEAQQQRLSKQKKRANHPSRTVNNKEMVLVTNAMKKFDANTWIADSGASTHMCNSLEGIFDLEDTNLSILVGDNGSQGWKVQRIQSGSRKEFDSNCIDMYPMFPN